MFFLLVFWVCFSSSAAIAGNAGTDIVLRKELPLRAGPENETESIEFLNQGTIVKILSIQKNWLKVKHNDQVGYIENNPENFRKKTLPNTPLERAQLKAEEIQQQLKVAAEQIESSAKKEARILDQLDNTKRQLNQIRAEMTNTQIELTKILAEIDNHSETLQYLQKKILERENYASMRLVALYKLCWLGELPVLAGADSDIDFIRRKAGLEFIIANDQFVLDELLQQKKAYDQMLAQLDQKESKKRAIEGQLLNQNEKLSVQLNEKTRLLSQIKDRKDLQMAAADELKQAAQKLKETIASLSEPTSEYLNEFNRKEADFSKFKGLLNLPVKGKIIYFYGPFRNKRLDVVNFRTGITIQAERGEPIRSVGNGITIFANWFRGYGNMIIIDHGNHYYTVYAFLEELFKSKGDRVETDEVIATVGDTGSMGGTGLHFEVRHYDKPLDPMEWIRKG